MNRRGFLAALATTPIALVVGEVMTRDVHTDLRSLVADLDVADSYPKYESFTWPGYGSDFVPERFPPAPPRWDADGRDTHHPMYVTKEMVGFGFTTKRDNP